MQQDGSASFGAFFWGFSARRAKFASARASFTFTFTGTVSHHNKHSNRGLTVKASRGGVLSVCPQMRVDEPRPSSARGETPRSHVPHVAVSLFVASPASGAENAAVAAEAQKAATHPARRRGEERPYLRRRGDGVKALLCHRASPRAAPPGGVAQRCAILVCLMTLAKVCKLCSPSGAFSELERPQDTGEL